MMGRLAIIAPLAWRNIWRNPRRTIITLIVVSVGLFSILLFAAIMQAWAQSSRDRTLTLLTGNAQIHAPGFLDDPTISHLMPAPSPALKQALDTPQITTWAPRLLVPAVIQSEYRSVPATLAAVEPAREQRLSTIPGGITQGQYLQSADSPQIILGKHLAQRLKTRPGKRVIVLAQSADGTLAEQSFRVGGLYAGDIEIQKQYAFAGLQTAGAMLKTDGRLSEIALRLPPDAQIQNTLDKLRAAAPDLDIRSWKQLSPLASAIDDMMGFVVYLWLWVMFLLMGFGIVNTQLMAVFERVREFGLLQALGMRPGSVLAIVALESAILVGIGVIIGIIGAVLAVRAMAGGIDLSFFAEGAAMIGAGQTMYPTLSAPEILRLSAIVYGLGVIVALWPAYKAAKSSPVEAMTHVS